MHCARRFVVRVSILSLNRSISIGMRTAVKESDWRELRHTIKAYITFTKRAVFVAIKKLWQKCLNCYLSLFSALENILRPTASKSSFIFYFDKINLRSLVTTAPKLITSLFIVPNDVFGKKKLSQCHFAHHKSTGPVSKPSLLGVRWASNRPSLDTARNEEKFEFLKEMLNFLQRQLNAAGQTA